MASLIMNGGCEAGGLDPPVDGVAEGSNRQALMVIDESDELGARNSCTGQCDEIRETTMQDAMDCCVVLHENTLASLEKASIDQNTNNSNRE